MTARRISALRSRRGNRPHAIRRHWVAHAAVVVIATAAGVAVLASRPPSDVAPKGPEPAGMVPARALAGEFWVLDDRAAPR